MSSSDSTVTYTSISSKDVPFWGIYFFSMEQPDSPEAASQGDDGDDDDGESSRDDADAEEEEDHFAPADSAIVIPTVELVSPPEGTEPVIPPPFTNTTTTGARITTLRLASTQALIDAVTTALPSPPLPPPLYIPPPVDCRDDILETEMPPRKRLCLSILGSRYEIEESSTDRPTREPMYPEYIPIEDEHVLLAEEQPLPTLVSHTAESPGYVVESDLKEYED
nr:hypothetical protein [Tanacetum cinerariifolium]